MNKVTMEEAEGSLAGIVRQMRDHERGPVAITVNGEEVAVLLSRSEFEALDAFREEHEFEAVFEDLEASVAGQAGSTPEGGRQG